MDGLGAPREAVSWNDDFVNDESSEDEEGMEGAMATDGNKFEVLCDGVLNTLALLHESLRDFLEVKDMLLQHFLPPSVQLSLSVTSSKLFRSATDIQEPIHELIRLVRTFSTPWEEKSTALKKIHEEFHKKRRQLDVAIRKLNQIDALSKKIAYERKILNWEKLYCKVTSARSHGRRWKYTIKDLKETAQQGYDILVHHVDQIEQDINEPFPEVELRTESVAPQMDPIAEEGEEGSRIDEELLALVIKNQENTPSPPPQIVTQAEEVSAGELGSEHSDSEESLGPETLQSGFSLQVPTATVTEPPKPEGVEIGVCTDVAEYDTTLYVRCFCPNDIEGREIKCSITLGAQFEKTSRLDFTDEEIAQQMADAPEPKPKGPKRKGAPPPPPEPETPKPVKFSELRFPLRKKMVGRKEIPPRLEPLTVSIHVGPDEEIVGMATIEVEDIEGCEMPEVFELPDSFGAWELSLQDSTVYTNNASVDASLQLAEPLPVSFPIYPLGGGKAGSEIKAIGSVPMFFYYKKTYVPKLLSRAIGTINLRDLILEEIGVDIHEHTKESLFPETATTAISPMTVMSTPPPPPPVMEDSVPMEEFEAVLTSHQRDMDMMQKKYESRISSMQEQIDRLENALNSQSRVVIHSETPEAKPKQFVYQREKRDAKKIPRDLKLPRWGESFPEDFYERMELFQEEAEANRRAITDHMRREESENIEKKLAFQHKAFRGLNTDVVDALKDVTLPSLYSSNTGNNVYNPRVYQYFHPTGTTGLRLTQPPSMMNLPPLKNKMSVINLFDIGQSIHNPNQLLQKYMSMKNVQEDTTLRSEAPVNTADPYKRQSTVSPGERLQSTSKD